MTGEQLLADFVEASLVIFGPLLPYFFGAILAGGLIAGLVEAALTIGKIPKLEAFNSKAERR